MDTMPPQAPPALTQSAYQEATDAFDRLVALQSWLATEDARVPTLPDTLAAGALPAYLTALAAYWDAPPLDGPEGSSRRAALASRLATAARDLALLAQHDGTLDDDALALVRDLVATGAGNLPAHLSVREPMVGPSVYAGVLLLQDLRHPERTLVFSTQHGWEVFPRLADALARMEQRARRALVATPDLPGIARQHLTSLGPDPFLTSRPIPGQPFDALVDALLQTQRDKLQQAGFAFALASHDDTSRATTFTDTAFAALRLDRAVDVTHILALRHAALIERFNDQRLTRVPQAVAQDWRDAEALFRATLPAIAAREADAGWLPPPSLAEYAANALGERLRARGITLDPADIQIRIDRGPDPAARLESLQALFEGPAPAHLRLIDLAYQNIATFEPVRLTALTAEGTPLDALDDPAIRQLVRSLDLASRYSALLQTTFRSGPDAALRREHAASLQQAHMGLLAAEARLAYYLTDAPRSFRDDHAERGYRWVRAVLDAPNAADRARVEGHEIAVHQVTYQGTPLRDVLVFGVRNPASVPTIVMYTPDAPDGISFREFDDRAEAGRRFLYHPAFREYLLDRLPLEYARVLPNGAAREFAGDHLAHWVLGASDSAAYTRTAARFEERLLPGNFLDDAYEVDVQLGLRNVQTLTRSAEQANWAWLRDHARSTLNHRLLHDALQGVLTAPARAAQAAWRFYDTVKTGDQAQALVDFADFYNASLAAAAPVQAFSSAPLARAILGARFRLAGRLVEARPTLQPTVHFDAAYLAKGVRKTGQPNHDGIFTLQGRSYIEHHGKLYHARFDGDIGTWRLSRPHGNAAFRGPAIRRAGNGQWAYHELGPRGGMLPAPAGRANQPELYNEYLAEFEAAFPDPFERDLIRTQMRRELTENVPAANVTAEQRLRWNGAAVRAQARVAQRAQSVRPVPDLLPINSPPPPAPAGFRRIARTDAPTDLWYYGEMPFKDSDLIRHRGGLGYSKDMAEFQTRFIAHDMHGVRVTTVPPTARIEDIRNAMGAPNLTRSSTFSVRIDLGAVYDPLSPQWRARYLWQGNGPNAELFARTEGPANVFFVRRDDGTLKLGRGQFHVEPSLPPAAIP